MTTSEQLLRNLLVAMRLDHKGVQTRLKKAREAAGITQAQAADLMKVHKGTIENDEGRVRDTRAIWDRLNDYAARYNVPVEYPLWGDDVRVYDRPGADQFSELVRRLEELVDRLAPVVEPEPAARGDLGPETRVRSG